ncbi:MAG: nucleoside deaminase [Coriobacteriia bacterium]|nr:nucleoside deaminase [Coriobacteriia bacterium]
MQITEDILRPNQDVWDNTFMDMALEQAKGAAKLGEVPIGAVVVYDPIDPATRKHTQAEPSVLATAFNLRETLQDPAGHAEFSALRLASQRLGAWRLTGCTVYVTLEPCLMCAGLMHQARVDRCVYGAADAKAGALGSLYQLNADERLNHTYPVTAGVREAECAQLLKDFFARRRAGRTGAQGGIA